MRLLGYSALPQDDKHQLSSSVQAYYKAASLANGTRDAQTFALDATYRAQMMEKRIQPDLACSGRANTSMRTSWRRCEHQAHKGEQLGDTLETLWGFEAVVLENGQVDLLVFAEDPAVPTSRLQVILLVIVQLVRLWVGVQAESATLSREALDQFSNSLWSVSAAQHELPELSADCKVELDPPFTVVPRIPVCDTLQCCVCCSCYTASYHHSMLNSWLVIS